MFRAASRFSSAVLVCLLAAPPAAAQVPPDEAWRAVETEHFRIAFPAHLEETGRRVAELAEEALSSHDVETCPVRLGRRVAFARSLISGQVAQEFEPDGKAAFEMARLHSFVSEVLHDFTPSPNGDPPNDQ